MSNDTRLYDLWLASVDGIGSTIYDGLIARFGSARAVFENAPTHEQALRSIPYMGEKKSAALRGCCNERYLDGLRRRFSLPGLVALLRTDSNYPDALRVLTNPPVVLFCMGNPQLLHAPRSIAVIGTRTPTQYGREMAGRIAGDLAAQGICVVSGMARGIDCSAHLGALQRQGDTIAVLGCGVDIIYPTQKAYVYQSIAQQGLLVSEYFPGTPALSAHFPLRNRIISALARGVLVVEAGIGSGTGITVKHARAQGRDIFALPGNIDSAASEATNLLIQQGAFMVTSAQNIVQRYGWQPAAGRPAAARMVAKPTPGMTPQEQKLAHLLAGEPMDFDAIFEQMQWSMSELFTLLTKMEIAGIVEQRPGRVYALAQGVRL